MKHERKALSEDDVKDLLERLSRVAIYQTLDFRVEELTEGGCRLTVPRKTRYDGIYDSFHGGLLTTVADSAAGIAVFTLAGVEEPITTTDLHIRFLAPCVTDVTAAAEVIKFGRTLCPVDVELFDAAGKLVAVSQVTYIRLSSIPKKEELRQ